MQLNDLKNLLGIAIATDQEPIFEARLAAAVDQAKQYTNNPFVDIDGNEIIPAGAQMGIALMVQAMGEKQNVSGQSLGDMSKSFFQNGTFNAANPYLRPYRKAKFV
jgi:hypothetical protein